MTNTITKHDVTAEPVDLFDRLEQWFSNWAPIVPFRALSEGATEGGGMVRVEEFEQEGNLVIRAELPGVDPDKDVEITVADGMLHIKGERREEQKSEDRGYVRREIRYGSFARSLPMPTGASEADITARYDNGILEVTVPRGEAPAPKRIEIGH